VERDQSASHGSFYGRLLELGVLQRYRAPRFILVRYTNPNDLLLIFSEFVKTPRVVKVTGERVSLFVSVKHGHGMTKL
jgi:hypothetical protein